MREKFQTVNKPSVEFIKMSTVPLPNYFLTQRQSFIFFMPFVIKKLHLSLSQLTRIGTGDTHEPINAVASQKGPVFRFSLGVYITS